MTVTYDMIREKQASKPSPFTRLAKPVLAASDVPYASTLVFNAGVCKWQGGYVMLFRNDYGRDGDPSFDGTNLGLARSDDGITWRVHPEPVWDAAEEGLRRATDGDVTRPYDPRLTVVDGELFLCFACDTHHGIRGGIARVGPDLRSFEVLSLSTPDNRNMVLFPHKVAGKFARLERPMPVYSRGRDRFDLWFSDSPDLAYWGNSRLVAGVEDFPYANDKIGPGAPPVLTDRGWLAVVHCVDRDEARGKRGWEKRWQKRYTAGLVLLDTHAPWRVVGICPDPVLVPEATCELDGFRGDVIFPGGMILEDGGEVKVYYGAADTVECLATARIEDLLALCIPVAT